MTCLLRRRAQRIVGFFFIFATIGAEADTPKTGTIKIDKLVPARFEQSFTYGQQPASLEHKLKDEAGLCDYEFGFHVEFGFEQPRFALKNLTATITSIKLLLTLRSTIWLSDRADQRIRAHEDAHRDICETYYRDADVIARDLAQHQLGQKITVPKSAGPDALKAALEKVQQQLVEEFKRVVIDRCGFAEVRFDAITDHSRKDIENSEAITLALTEERGRKDR